jgi:uncharacterized protein (DUF4415 family)
MRREYDFSKAKRGPAVAAPKGKARITIRLDEEVLEWLAQADAAAVVLPDAINAALVDHIKREPSRRADTAPCAVKSAAS